MPYFHDLKEYKSHIDKLKEDIQFVEMAYTSEGSPAIGSVRRVLDAANEHLKKMESDYRWRENGCPYPCSDSCSEHDPH